MSRGTRTETETQLRSPKHEFELVQTMIELRFGDHQRRRQPDGRAVRVLGEYPSRGQRLTDITTGAEARDRCQRRPTSPRERTPTTPRPIMLSSRSRN